MQKIRFFFNGKHPVLTERKRLKLFIEEIFKQEEKTLKSLSFIFCSDKYLLGINIKFLAHDFYTDIITFDLSSNKNLIEGEVYLSVDRVNDNANKLGTHFNEELHRVMFHGILHLCGYNDKKKTDSDLMRFLEKKYLNQYFN